jgi:hypothetical protein
MSGDPTASLPERPRVDLTTSRRIARLLDDVATVPGTDVGVGLDALMGLVPGIGDLAGSTLSGVIVYDAVRCRVPVPTLARMGWNLILDALLGLVPFVGDLADVAHRANRKNYRLLERAVEANPYPDPPTVGYLLAAVALVFVPLVFAVVLGFVALYFLIRWLV